MGHGIPALPTGSAPVPQGVQGEIYGEGIKFTDDRQLGATNDYVTITGEDLVRQRVMFCLATRPGEWAFHPTWGCGVTAYLGQAMPTAARKELASRITEQLSQIVGVEQVVSVDVEQPQVDQLVVTVAVKVIGRTVRFKPFTFTKGTT